MELSLTCLLVACFAINYVASDSLPLMHEANDEFGEIDATDVQSHYDAGDVDENDALSNRIVAETIREDRSGNHYNRNSNNQKSNLYKG